MMINIFAHLVDICINMFYRVFEYWKTVKMLSKMNELFVSYKNACQKQKFSVGWAAVVKGSVLKVVCRCPSRASCQGLTFLYKIKVTSFNE